MITIQIRIIGADQHAAELGAAAIRAKMGSRASLTPARPGRGDEYLVYGSLTVDEPAIADVTTLDAIAEQRKDARHD